MPRRRAERRGGDGLCTPSSGRGRGAACRQLARRVPAPRARLPRPETRRAARPRRAALHHGVGPARRIAQLPTGCGGRAHGRLRGGGQVQRRAHRGPGRRGGLDGHARARAPRPAEPARRRRAGLSGLLQRHHQMHLKGLHH